MNLDLLLAACRAALGADVMTVDNELGRPELYREARTVNRRGREELMLAGASEALSLERVLIG